MEKIKKLPDAEFEIMKVVWANEPPITTPIIMEHLDTDGRFPNAPACGTRVPAI